MFKTICLGFLGLLFLGSLSAQTTATYKRASGLPGIWVIEDKNGSRFYADKDGKNVFGDKKFDVALTFACGYAPVQMKGADKEWIYIDTKGNEAMKFTDVGEAEPFKVAGCKAGLLNVTPSKYNGCGKYICDCIISDVKNSNNAEGKNHVFYKLSCGKEAYKINFL